MDSYVQTGDCGFYRVNPPMHKLISGHAANCLANAKMEVYPASGMPSGERLEFQLGKKFTRQHATDYSRFLIAGRLVRLPFVLAAGWLLLHMLPGKARSACLIAAVLFLTSPMTLGHGWAVMPDSIAAVMTVALIATSLVWLRERTTISLLIVGVTWGFALGTKFTFCPLFLTWPIALAIACPTRTLGEMARLLLAHVAQGFVALAVIIVLYNFSGVGIPLDEHRFESRTLKLTTRWLGSAPSPFPRQFLIGIDEQQQDLEGGCPSYLLGHWYPDGYRWYYIIGVLAKEQLAFVLLGAIGVGLLCFQKAHIDKELRPCFSLCLMIVLTIFGILTFNDKMALNIRYVLPALPAAYLLIGIVVAVFWEHHRWLRTITGVLIGFEVLLNFPHYFSYSSPIVGSSYRIPPALHDSNFDGGQDLWRVASWLQDHPPELGVPRFVCVHSSLPREALGFEPSVPQARELRALLLRQNSPAMEVIVMRGLGVPAPWTVAFGADEEQSELLRQLLLTQPTQWISPTVVVYRTAPAK